MLQSQYEMYNFDESLSGEQNQQNQNFPNSTNNVGIKDMPESDENRREIGNEGVWSLSSKKSGNGIEQLRDENISTFWQSDDIQPHFITIEFQKKTRVSEIWLYLDYKTDESYTPSRIAIRYENSFGEIVELKVLDYDQPVGWYQISLEEKNSDNEIYKPYIKSNMVQIVILQNNHNGRDTHIRCVKIFGPRIRRSFDANLPVFQGSGFVEYEEIR